MRTEPLPIAMAQLQLLRQLMDTQYDLHGCLLQAGIVKPPEADLEYLNAFIEEFIHAPSYIAWEHLRSIVLDRVGWRETTGAADDWWEDHITQQDVVQASLKIEGIIENHIRDARAAAGMTPVR